MLSAGYTYGNIKFNNINYNLILTQTLKSEKRSPENIKNQASLKRELKAFCGANHSAVICRIWKNYASRFFNVNVSITKDKGKAR